MGRPDKIKITPEAAQWIADRGGEMWVQVVLGGCTGLTYHWSRRPLQHDQLVMDWGGAKIYTDAPSLPLLKGAKISLKKSLVGQGLEIENPEASRSCPCKKSFSTPAAKEVRHLLERREGCAQKG